MKNRIIFIDQVINLDGRWAHVVMLELAPDSTLLHLRQEVKHPFGVSGHAEFADRELMDHLPPPVLRDEAGELVLNGSQIGGSGTQDQLVFVYASQAQGTVTMIDSHDTELLTVRL